MNGCGGHVGTAGILTGNIERRIDGLFAEWDAVLTPGCALGVFLGGEIVYSRGYGMSNLEHDIPIASNSIFHVASISKQFAAHCIVLLAKEGRLSLEDDIREYLPELQDFGETITIQHLIHHTSGLRDQWELLRLAGWRSDDLITDDDVLEIALLQDELNFPPTDQYFYSNTGYTFLGLIIQRVTGRSLRRFADERIFEPLGMSSTHFHDDHNEIVPNRTHGYSPRKDGVGYRVDNPVFDTTGATSLHTTIEDLFRWDRYLERFLADEANEPYLRTAVVNDGADPHYGCGLRYAKRHGVETVGHSGADAGYRAHYIRVPEHRLGIAVLCNLSTMRPAKLVDDVLGLVVGRLGGSAEPSPEIVDVAGDDLAEWTGIYRGLRTGAVQQVDAGDGFLTLPLQDDLKLEPISVERFVNEVYFGSEIRFEVDPDDGTTQAEFGDLDTFERVASESPIVDDIDQYAGRYRSDELDADYELTVEDGLLSWKQRRFDPRPLAPVLADLFVRGPFWFEFERDEDGAVSGFNVSSMRARRMRFVRME